jgi:hypothetical protein
MFFVRPLLLIVCLASVAAEAAPAALAACRELGRNDPVATDRCLTHVKLFETPGDIIAACSTMSQSFDVRFRCLKSGADMEALRLCVASGWSVENKLSCLRASPGKRTMRACLAAGGREEEMLECVRLGRD